MLFTFKNRVLLMRYGGVSGVTSFITIDEQLQLNQGCCFPMGAMLPESFPFHQFLFTCFRPIKGV